MVARIKTSRSHEKGMSVKSSLQNARKGSNAVNDADSLEEMGVDLGGLVYFHFLQDVSLWSLLDMGVNSPS